MRYLRNTAIALMAIGGAALIGSAATAQTPYGYGARHSGIYSHGAYGAHRDNPNFARGGLDHDTGRN